MPIYEYLCVPCNRVYSFWAKSPNETRQPVCPKCGAGELKKRISKFAFIGGTRKTGARDTPAAGDEPAAGAGASDRPSPDARLDDPRVEHEMMKLMDAAEGVDENDPRQIGRLMRRMSEITGETLDGEMETAVRRLEAGEDPEKIEEDMGDLLGDEAGGAGAGGPAYDDGLYPM